MTTVQDVVERWRQWRKGLAYAFLVARRVRVHVQVGLELQGVNEDEDLRDLRLALPGWRVDWSGDDSVRLVPPGIGVKR